MQGSPILNANGARLSESVIKASLSGFHSGLGRTMRADGSGWSVPNASALNLADYRAKRNGRTITEMVRRRVDGFSPTAGFHLARDLEHVHAEILKEEFPIPSAMRSFNVDNSVPVGAASHTIRRRYEHGEARVHRGPSTEIPRVGQTQREETFPIRHIVSSYGWDVFEAMSDRYAGAGKLSDDARISRDVNMRLANDIWWGINSAGAPHGLYGVLNYPWLPKKVIATGVSRATVLASPDAALGELHDLVNFPFEESQGVFGPDTLLLTRRAYNVLNTVRFSAGSDMTVFKHFMETTDVIKSYDVVEELKDAGGVGVDGILAYRKDQMGIQLVMPQGHTQLPLYQKSSLESEIVGYMSIGGVVMRNPLNNILGLWDTTA